MGLRVWDSTNFTMQGISVSYTPDINIYAVADTTIYLMIGALRQITAASDALRKGWC